MRERLRAASYRTGGGGGKKKSGKERKRAKKKVRGEGRRRARGKNRGAGGGTVTVERQRRQIVSVFEKQQDITANFSLCIISVFLSVTCYALGSNLQQASSPPFVYFLNTVNQYGFCLTPEKK